MENALRKIELMEALEQAKNEIQASPNDEQRFKVTDKDSANWCLRKMRALKAEIEDNNRIAREEIERIQRWQEEVNEPLERSMQYFEALLAEYHFGIYSEDPKAKTIKLPHGTLKMRAQQPEFVRDEKALLEYLRRNGRTNFIEIIEKPKWGEYKKVVQLAGDGRTVVDSQTGEIVEGVTAEPRPPKFSVEVS